MIGEFLFNLIIKKNLISMSSIIYFLEKLHCKNPVQNLWNEILSNFQTENERGEEVPRTWNVSIPISKCRKDYFSQCKEWKRNHWLHTQSLSVSWRAPLRLQIPSKPVAFKTASNEEEKRVPGLGILEQKPSGLLPFVWETWMAEEQI